VNLGGYRVALRVARRDALRDKGRSALVLCMIGVPVLAIVALAVLYATYDWNPVERLPHELGRADARLQYVGGPVSQDVLGEYWEHLEEPDEVAPGDSWDTPQVAQAVTARFGPGARVLPLLDGATDLRTPRGYSWVGVREVDLRDPATAGMLTLLEGRLPASHEEVAVSEGLRDRGYRIGGTIRLTRADTPKRIVGHLADPLGEPYGQFVQTLPGSGLIPAEERSPEWLLVAGRAVTWPDVEHLNRLGLVVTSAELVRDPPSGAGLQSMEETSPAFIAVVAMAVAMIVLEVVLLAGPAFAVGIRRQRRRLALVLAAGGEPRHLRAMVLAVGAVLGILAAVAGAVLGLGLAAAAVPVLERLTGNRMGPYEVPWKLVAAPVALGALSGLLAACVPAVQAARTDVVAALAGRRERARGRGRIGWPIAGAFAIAGGVVLSLGGIRFWQEFGPAFGAAAIIVGCVMISPWLVGVTARPARALPLPLRLAVRDGARHRGRTAPAVAAIMAAVAGVTALAIGGASDFAQQRIEYQAELPMGSALVGINEGRAEQIRRVLHKELPGVPLREVYLADSLSGCEATETPRCRWLRLGRKSTLEGNLVAVRPGDVGLLLGRHDPEAVRVLEEGGIILPNGRKTDGRVMDLRLMEERPPKDPEGEPKRRVVREFKAPVLTVPEPLPSEAVAVISVRSARELGLPTTLRYYGIDRADHRVTPAQEEQITERIAALLPEDISPDLYVERGFTESFAVPLLLLALAGGIMVFGGSMIVTGLSIADARPDLATLAAVGARPGTRRLLTMSQAAFTALLGCWLGIAAGIVPGIAVAYPLTDNSYLTAPSADRSAEMHGVIIDIPWALLAALGLLVPLLAALAAGMFTRSRLPVTRRIG